MLFYFRIGRRLLIAALVLATALVPSFSLAHPLNAAVDIDTSVGKVRWAYYVPYAANSLESLRQNIGSLSYLSPYWYQIDEEGTLVSSGSREVEDVNRAAVLQLVHDHRVRVLPMIKNSATYGDFHPVLADDALRARAIGLIVRTVVDNGFDGAHIDFEGIDGADRPHLTAFMAALASALRQNGKLVTQAVPAKETERTTGWAGAYDYAALAPSNDFIVVMTYGYGISVPQSTAPYPWVERSMAYATSQIPPEKLLLGLAWYGYDWNRTAGGVTPLRYADAMARARDYSAQINYDEVTQTPNFTYNADDQEHEVWYEDRRSNHAKMDLVFRYGLAGAAGWRMGHEDPGVWSLYRDRLGFRTWYLAEGSTGTPYHTWVLIQNPNPTAVAAKVTFMKEDGSTPVFQYTLKPLSRFSIFVNNLVPNAAFSTKVEADAPVLVERAMYFGYDGHDSSGVNAPNRRWYLPAGSSRDGRHTWVLLMNPNSAPTTAHVTFMRSDGSPVRRDFNLKPTSRLNIFANQHVPDSVFSTLVEADLPIVAERASYFDGGKAGYGSVGSPFASRRWHVAEGFTGHTVTFALMNPNPVSARVTLTFMRESGENMRRTLSLVPLSRQTFVANDVLPKDTAFSTLIEADQPVVAERVSFVPGGGAQGALAIPAPAKTWFLAEGSTAPPFTEYVLLQNPNPETTHTKVTFMTEGGKNAVKELDLAPRSRFTIDAGSIVPNTATSVRIDSSQPVVVERAMYFGRGSHANVGVGQ